MKIVRGDVITVTATPKDAAGNPVVPATMKLYLKYKHADGATSVDTPIDMTGPDGNGAYTATFDTSVALAGTLEGSIRATGPSAAFDFKETLTANGANPNPTP